MGQDRKDSTFDQAKYRRTQKGSRTGREEPQVAVRGGAT